MKPDLTDWTLGNVLEDKAFETIGKKHLENIIKECAANILDEFLSDRSLSWFEIGSDKYGMFVRADIDISDDNHVSSRRYLDDLFKDYLYSPEDIEKHMISKELINIEQFIGKLHELHSALENRISGRVA